MGVKKTISPEVKKFRQYEAKKRRLARKKLTPEKYEAHLKKLVEEMKL